MKSLWLSLVTAAALACGAVQAQTVVSVTQVRYDADGRPLCTAVRMNSSAYGALPADACALGATGSYGSDRITYDQYDNVGQLTEVDQAYGISGTQRAYARYSYNPDGTKATETDANGNTTGYIYDGFDRLSQIQYPSTTTPGAVDTTNYEQFGYDNNDNKTSWRRRNGKTISYIYDNLNRETERQVSDGSVPAVYSGYDLEGHMLYARYGSTSGAGVTSYYDGLGRLDHTVDLNGRTIQHFYNQASAPVGLLYPDGVGINYIRDALDRIGAVGYNASSGLISEAYDNLGRRTWIGRSPNASGNNLAGYTSLAFDGLGRLTSLNNTLAGSAYNITWGFTYNPANQVATTSASSSIYDYKETATTTVNNTYDGLNRDASIAALGGGYDVDGNLANDGTRLFYYDVYNRLIGVGSSAYPQNGPYLTFTYDPLGRLVTQTDYGTTTEFLYDGTNLVAEYDGSGNMLERYIHGDDADEPLVWFHGSGNSDERFFIQDYHGGVIGYTDASGNLQTLYKYGPFGEPKDINNGTNFAGARFRYTGQMVIPEASLYYYKARVYDPIMGHFLQTDPIGSKDDLDLYAYVGDDPVDHGDPTGTQCAVVCPNGDAARQQTKEGAAIVQTVIKHPGQSMEVAGTAVQAASIVTAQPEGVVAGNRISAAGSAIRAVDGEDVGTAVPVTTTEGSTKQVLTRGTPGSDGGVSTQTIERDSNGNVISRTHTVTTPDGEVVHQHTNSVGKSGGVRQFPDEWTGTTTKNAPYENKPPQFGKNE